MKSFYGLQDTSRRCCVVCTRPNFDTPKGQVCTRCSAVIRATHHAHVNLPIPFVKVCLAWNHMGRSVPNFIDAVYALLDQLDAKRWLPGFVLLAFLWVGCNGSSMSLEPPVDELPIHSGGRGWVQHREPPADFVLLYPSEHEWMLAPLGQAGWWSAWHGVVLELDGLYRVTFHGRARMPSTAFYFAVAPADSVRYPLFIRSIKTDRGGVFSDFIFEASGSTVLLFASESEAFIIRGFRVVKLE